MSNGSPTAYLLWAILSCIFLTFLLLHLWAYDRFNCLKWDSGRQPGAFKRVMTYSYVATLPLLVIFSVSLTVFKFKEGYWMSPSGTVIPRPLVLWDPDHKRWLLPLYFVLSIAWSLELVTHLEELSFWLFLLHQGPGKRDWFHSWEFRIWYTGSIIAVLGMPLTTLVSRREIERVQAWIFLAGSSAGTSTTVSFLYVLARFPGFIQHVKEGGAEPDVVVRLATFYSLNRIRVMFRFLFTIPLLIIGIDALHPPYPIVADPFALDFLLMMGGMGCFISSAITLLIFFPRSITRESGYKAKIVSPQNSGKVPTVTSPLPNYYTHDQDHDPTTPKVYTPVSPVSVNGARMSAFRFPHQQYLHHQHPDDLPPPSPSPMPSPLPHHHDHDHLHPEYALYHAESLPGRRRRESESEYDISPGYESDIDSSGMHRSSIPFQTLVSPIHGGPGGPGPGGGGGNGGSAAPISPHPHVERQDSAQTAVSRPTSGARSDDTVVWERPEPSSPLAFPMPGNHRSPRSLHSHIPVEVLAPLEPMEVQVALPTRDLSLGSGSTGTAVAGESVKKRRRYSDGPFVYSRHSQFAHGGGLGIPIIQRRIQQSVPASEEGHRSRERERESSQLHPYVMNFTSPIDLLDYTPSDEGIHMV